MKENDKVAYMHIQGTGLQQVNLGLQSGNVSIIEQLIAEVKVNSGKHMYIPLLSQTRR